MGVALVRDSSNTALHDFTGLFPVSPEYVDPFIVALQGSFEPASQPNWPGALAPLPEPPQPSGVSVPWVNKTVSDPPMEADPLGDCGSWIFALL